MTIKLLNKDLISFLTEPFAENILPAFKYNKKVKRLEKKGVLGAFAPRKSSELSVISSSLGANALLGKEGKYKLSRSSNTLNSSDYLPLHFIKGESLSNKMRKAETQIIKQLSISKSNHSSQLLDSLKSQRSAFLPFIEESDKKRILPHLLFSLHQIKNESYQQGAFANSSVAPVTIRLTSLKRIQNKSYSEFKNQLRECKKVRLLYGHLSKRELEKSARKVKNFGTFSNEDLLIYLETRLDVTLERCGFFPSIRAARQFIIHGRIQINFQIIKIPSYQLQSGDIIKVKLKKGYKRVRAEIDTTFNTTIQVNKSKKKKITTIQSTIPKRKQDQVLYKSSKFLNFVNNSTFASRPRKQIQSTHISNFESELNKISNPPNSTLCGISCNNISADLCTQTHFYVQSILSRLDLTIKKKYYLESSHLGANAQISANNSERVSNSFQVTSAVLPYLNQYRFRIPPYALLSILHVESIFHSLHKKFGQDSGYLQKSFGARRGSAKALFYLFCYFLEMKKKCLYPRQNFWRQARFFPDLQDRNGYPFFFKEKEEKSPKWLSSRALTPTLQTNYYQKESKPLHLEISYQSLSAIFLYPPQQIYLNAMIDLDLILKSVVTKLN